MNSWINDKQNVLKMTMQNWTYKKCDEIFKMRNRHVHIILLSISFISQESFQQNLLTKQSLN